jgi:hypothetical protein
MFFMMIIITMLLLMMDIPSVIRNLDTDNMYNEGRCAYFLKEEYADT